MKESDIMKSKNTHAYMQVVVNVMFTQIHAKKEIKLFGEISIATMLKWFEQLDEGEIPGKPVVISFNIDELTDAERRKSL